MTRKRPSFLQLLQYVTREGRAAGEPLLHNLSTDGRDLLRLNRAFLANYRYCPPRRNGVALYHEVLSLSAEDADKATPEILRDLGEAYLALRAPQALAYGVVHFDDNPHLHLIISGNLRGRDKKLRLSRREFAAVKRELEAYQRERYPELTHSLVFPEQAPAGKEPQRSLAEQEQARREQRQGRRSSTRKQRLQSQVLAALEGAGSLPVFAEGLRQQDLWLYERNGRPAGIFSEGRKYRFRTLGVQEAFEQARERWGELQERRQGLRAIVAEKAQRFWRERFGYPEKIGAILCQPVGESARIRELEGMLGKKCQQPPRREISWDEVGT